MQHRIQKATAVANALKQHIHRTGIQHAHQVCTLLTCCVNQSLLYACEAWGPSLLRSCKLTNVIAPMTAQQRKVVDLVHNPVQTVCSDFLKGSMGLSWGVSHVALLLEFAISPMHVEIVKRICSFMESCTPYIERRDHDVLLVSAYESHKYQHTFMQYLEKKLGIHSGARFDGEAITKNVVCEWAEYVKCFRSVDLQSDSAPHRQISTYVQCFWGGNMNRRHTLHDMPHVPHDVFRSWVSLRFLQLPIPAYHQPKVNSQMPYSQRVCPAGCGCPCDVRHVLLECPATEQYRTKYLHSVPARVVDLFDEDLYDQLDVAWMVYGISRVFHGQASGLAAPDTSKL